MDALNKILASGGKKFVDDSNEHLDRHYGIQILEDDTTIASWTTDKGIDLLKRYNLTSKNLPASLKDIVIPLEDGDGVSIQLTDGKVALLLKRG
jgi:hypothetical protein